MSWDICVQDLPAGIASVAEIPDDFRPAHIGRRSDIIARIAELYPQADFSRPAWGVLDVLDCSIEFNLGDDEELEAFMLHVRGGDSAPHVVESILTALGLRALDMQSESGLFEFGANQTGKSFRRWRKYRDQVIPPPK